MTTGPRPRVGVVRPAGAHPVIAEAEARVIRCELERRLGPIDLDPRVDGDRSGPWLPLANASWPTDVDAVVEADELFADALPPLTCLFARTVDPDAASVRRRMLGHLGVSVETEFDDRSLADLAGLAITPTDLWLIVDGAPNVSVTDPAVGALAAADPERARLLDAAFDTVADRLGRDDIVAAASGRVVERQAARVAELEREVGELTELLARERAEHGAALDAVARQLAERRLRADTES